MKLPDIGGMERARAWAWIQHTLKQEQNQLPPGHGIWFNWYHYTEEKRHYICCPVNYKIKGFGGGTDDELRKKQLDASRRFHQRGFIAVRVSGPVVNSPQARAAKKREAEFWEQNQRNLDAEWKANCKREGFRILTPEEIDF
jgi:hypothetical protein